MDSLIETFHIDWHLMVAQIINFAIVFFVLYRFAFRPLMKMMDERSQTIKDGLKDADEKKHLLEEAKKAYEETLVGARKEASEIMKNIKTEAEEKRAELLTKAQAEATAVLNEGKKQLETERSRMLEGAKKDLAQLVIGATEKVLGSVITGKVQQSVVEEKIKEFTK